MANLKDLIVNGSARILGTLYANVTGNATTATTATKIKVTDHSANNATYYPVWVTGAGASVDAYNTTSKLKFNPSTGVLTSTSFTGNLTGNVTGNASTATKATQDGSGNTITSTYVNLTGAQTISGVKTFSSTPVITSGHLNLNYDDDVSIQWKGVNFLRRSSGGGVVLSVADGTIYFRPKGDANTTNQATLDNTGNLTAVKFTGSLTGNVTGNCSGSSGSCTGNAATATVLQDMNRQPQGSLTNVSGNITIALTRQQMLYRIKPTANITGITLNTTAANLNASYAYTFELIIDMTAGAYTVSIPDSLCKWEGGTPPTINEQKMYMLVFRTMDAGSTWYGSLQGAW